MSSIQVAKVEMSNEAETTVFQNPLILDNILRYTAYEKWNEFEHLNRSDLAAIRLVAKSWLQSASRVVRKSKQSIIHLVLGEQIEVNGHFYKDSCREILDNFVSTFGYNKRTEDSILSLGLIINEQFLKKENFHCLKNSLKQCGDMLVSLTVNFSEKYGFMPVGFDKLDFPNLFDVNFNLGDLGIKNSQGTRNAVESIGNNGNGVNLLQQIFNGARNLKYFHYSLDEHCGASEELIYSIKLPKSLTSLNSLSRVFTRDYKILTQNDLPNLQKLHFGMSCIPCNDQLFKILDRVRTSLKILEVNKCIRLDTTETTLLRFPVMEAMKSILISGNNYQLDPNMGEALPKLLPKLRKLAIENQTESVLNKWIEKFRFENVRELSILLYNENYNFLSDSYHISPTFGVMHQLQTSFPNVCILHFNVNFDNEEPLKVIFRDWKQLEELHIIFHGRFCANATSNLLASTFLGVSVEKVQELRRIFVSSVDCTNLELECNSQNSVVNLNELTTLTLDTGGWTYFSNGNLASIKDLLPIAFNKMPNLKKTEFRRGFQ